MSDRERYEPSIWSERRDEDGHPSDDELQRLYGSVTADGVAERDYRPIHPQPAWRDLLRKLWAPIAFFGLLFWKFKFVLAAIFKFKIFTTAGTMLVSIRSYALAWGWKLDFGFLLLIIGDEIGRALDAPRQGLSV